MLLHEKLFYCQPKKVDLAQKSISCQKKDDAASKIFCAQKSYHFSPERRAISQGSILDPKLFILHINEICDDAICNIAISADDITF